MADPPAPVTELRVGRRTIGRLVGFYSSVALAVVTCVGTFLHQAGESAATVASVATLGLGAAVVRMLRLVVRVQVTAQELVVRRLDGSERRTPLRSVRSAVRVRSYDQRYATSPPSLVARARGDGVVLRLSSDVHPHDDLDRLARALERSRGRRVTWIGQPITQKELRRRHPWVVPLRHRLRWLTTTTTVLAIGAVIALVSFVF